MEMRKPASYLVDLWTRCERNGTRGFVTNMSVQVEAYQVGRDQDFGLNTLLNCHDDTND